MRFLKFLVPTVGIFATAALAPGALTWRTTQIAGKTKPGQDFFEAGFSFQNTGAKPVTVTSVEPGCSCTTATLARQTYAPGESGVLRTRMDVRGRSGPQEKTIAVTTDDAPQTPVILTLRVAVPATVEVSPRLLTWTIGDHAAPQEVTVTAGGDIAITLRSVRCDNPGFIFRQVTDVPGGRYRVLIAPRSTAAAQSAILRLEVEAVLGRPEILSVYARVR